LALEPQQEARAELDKLLRLTGWDVVDADQANIIGTRGVAIREFPLPAASAAS